MAIGADAGDAGVDQGTTDTDDASDGWLTGYPGPRVPHATTGAQGPDDQAAGFVTGYPGDRSPHHTR